MIAPPLDAALPARLVAALRAAGSTLAVAESLTGGQVTALLVAVPGASAVLRGGVVAYAADLKATLLDVPAGLLAAHGPVHPQVAAEMARGAAARLGAEHGIGTTGVAGPGPADGAPAGTAYVAVHGQGGTRVRPLLLAGTRPAVRRSVALAALALLGGLVVDESRAGEQTGAPGRCTER